MLLQKLLRPQHKRIRIPLSWREPNLQINLMRLRMISKINTNRNIRLLILLYKLHQPIIGLRSQLNDGYMNKVDLLIVKGVIDVLPDQAHVGT